MFDRKYILRQRIDTLKEYTRIQLYLIRQEQHTASLVNKEYFSNKFKKLMSDFDAEKRKIKMELLGNFDKFTLIEHFNQMFKQQEETQKLIAGFKAKQELRIMDCLSTLEKYSSRNLNESLNSTLENVSEEIVSSFKPSEKSLRSILSSLPNSSLGTGRDSLSRRRSSASEALIKLRTMNIVPALPRSPPRQKSPPRTPRSPIERYLTKFPQNLTSRESISNDEIFVLRQSLGPVELLEDLPNASQLGMVLDLSHSPIASLPDVSTLIKKDEYAKEKEFIEKYVNSLWKPFIESGEIVIDSLSECQFSFMNSLSDSLKISKDFLQQLCYERWFNLIQNANRHLSSKQILSTEENLTGYLQKEILAPFVDKLEREIIPNGIKARAEKTSHLALDINRLLLAQYVYENLTI